ncbi:PREDICTED: proline-rich receptor-like protein kinase PERK8 [Nicotiana attenuata]|uniref:proline-rich receptor-like protein kinase PERK8 n=1 Tax=Nicotiana attenuata TaxID=49451 RepID=UPI0009053455|nr:PREDICTED: proline-rich receptor-like protein kinase PERK8 [Nicotiana attenuata]
MASKLNKLLFTLLYFLLLILNFPARITAQECPYPCYPPPTGPAGNNPPPATTTPPSPQGYVPNNPSTNYNPPPAGYNNPPNDYDNSPPDFVNGEVPPPPEPIVPWFPFYYRKPPHSDNDQSSSSISIQESRISWKNMMIITTIFPLIFMTLLFQ